MQLRVCTKHPSSKFAGGRSLTSAVVPVQDASVHVARADQQPERGQGVRWEAGAERSLHLLWYSREHHPVMVLTNLSATANPDAHLETIPVPKRLTTPVTFSQTMEPLPRGMFLRFVGPCR